jgi:hypothetical protein
MPVPHGSGVILAAILAGEQRSPKPRRTRRAARREAAAQWRAVLPSAVPAQTGRVVRAPGASLDR